MAGDDRAAACDQCLHKGIDCVRCGNVRFRHTCFNDLANIYSFRGAARPSVASSPQTLPNLRRSEFHPDQIWIAIESNLAFIDETRTITNFYCETSTSPEQDSSFQASTKSSDNTAAPHSTPATQSTNGPPTSPAVNIVLTKSQAQPLLCDQSSPSKTLHTLESALSVGIDVNGQARSPEPSLDSCSLSDEGDTVVSPGELFTDVSARQEAVPARCLGSPGWQWPLESRDEAQLLQHFVRSVAPNLDLTDPMCHFASVVPVRAQDCPLLRTAIFAASARHLSRTNSLDSLVADR